MSVAELLSTLQTLSRADKLKVMQFLVQELAVEEKALLLQPGATYAVWSPYNSHDATQQLAALLEEDKQANLKVPLPKGDQLLNLPLHAFKLIHHLSIGEPNYSQAIAF